MQTFPSGEGTEARKRGKQKLGENWQQEINTDEGKDVGTFYCLKLNSQQLCNVVSHCDLIKRKKKAR